MNFWCHACGKAIPSEVMLERCAFCESEVIENITHNTDGARFIPYTVPHTIVPDFTIRFRIITYIQEEEPDSIGLTEKTIDNLKRIECTDNCSICQQEEQQGKGVELPCKHAFHQNCIVPWFKGNHTCPTCRAEVPQSL